MAVNGRRIWRGALRGVLVLCASAVIAWTVIVLRGASARADLNAMAEKLVRGHPYRREDIARVLASGIPSAGDHAVRALTLRNDAILELRRLETAIAEGRREEIELSSESLGRLLQSALTASPSDPFLWLVMYWRKNLVDGFDEKHLGALAMSYRLGPNEGWIGVGRSRLALAAYRHLSPDMQRQVVTEFASLVDSGFHEMPGILVGAGWGARNVLLDGLAGATELKRKDLARSLGQLGYDLPVPGIARADSRPWSR